MKKIFISSDHAGFNLKEQIKKKFCKKFLFTDMGTDNSKKSVNYPDYAHKLSKKVSNNRKNIGILVCGSGMGMSMAANKHKKIRAAVCYSVKNAKLSRLHNNANIITLGSRLTNKNTAFKCVEVFVNTKFEGGRHKKRVKKI
ncbi:MAG: ribose 5-phosphate isomerase B [Pelagibacterales bacterium MED-G44]|nr:MAG: ribose 5-phosphate isomerase B [Pelagibacterales bacterium MED-G44]